LEYLVNFVQEKFRFHGFTKMGLRNN